MAVSFLFKWDGTIFPLVLSDPLFWLLATVHAMLLAYHSHELAAGNPGLPPLDWQGSTVEMSLLTFFVIFYGNNCYARYFELFSHCIGIGRSLALFAHLVKKTFTNMPPARLWNMMRPMLGAMYVHYAKVHNGLDEDDWESIRERRLLTPKECELLARYHGNKQLLAATWALKEVHAALMHDHLESDPRRERIETQAALRTGRLATIEQIAVYNRFEDIGNEFAGFCASTMETLAQPVPFPYFHTLRLLLLIALLILGYALVELLEANLLLTPCLYFVSCLILLASSNCDGMSDPWRRRRGL